MCASKRDGQDNGPQYCMNKPHSQIVDVLLSVDEAIVFAKADIGSHVPCKVANPIIYHAHSTSSLAVHKFQLELSKELAQRFVNGRFLLQDFGPNRVMPCVSAEPFLPAG